MFDLKKGNEILGYFGGTARKTCILYEHQLYMVKGVEDVVPYKESLQRNEAFHSFNGPINLSECNQQRSPYAEDLGCKLYQCVGIPVQETFLTNHKFPGDRTNSEVVVCKSFIHPEQGERFVSAHDIFLAYNYNTVRTTRNRNKYWENHLLQNVKKDKDNRKHRIKIRHSYSYTNPYDAEYVARSIQGVSSKLTMDRYWKCFIFDALIGNFYRDMNKWGFIMEGYRYVDMSPVFSCGRGLGAFLTEDDLKIIKGKVGFREYERILFEVGIENKRVLKKFHYIVQDLANTLKLFFPTINMGHLYDIIKNYEGISPLRKEYLCESIDYRYNIIKNAYMKVK